MRRSLEAGQRCLFVVPHQLKKQGIVVLIVLTCAKAVGQMLGQGCVDLTGYVKTKCRHAVLMA